MKHFKKMMALIIALVMVMGTLSLSSAFAAPGDLTVDTKITITGLDKGDEVTLYKVLQWKDGEGWELVAPFDTDEVKALSDIKKLINPQKNQGKVELTKATAEKLAELAKTATSTQIVDTKTIDGEEYSYTTTDKPGMYIALVKPAEAGVVYNPIIVSADFSQENTTHTIDSSEMMGTSEDQAVASVAKKKKVTVKKTEEKITNDIGDEYNFKVETTIPTYSKSFVNTSFTVNDEMSAYLDLVASSFEVKTAAGVAVTPSSQQVVDGAQGWSITFDDGYIKALAAPQEIVITYKAKLNLTPEEAALLPTAKKEYNKVTIEFPNNPKNDKDRTVQRDGTREYTFTIDGSVLGHEPWRATELVKVGLDANDEPVMSMISFSHGNKEYPALNGALFGLYTTKAAADAATGPSSTNGLYTNTVFNGLVTSKDNGLLYIPGLDKGTYYLKELSAPKGFIKDTQTHTIVVDPHFVPVDVTEYYVVDDTNGTVTWFEEADTGREPYTYTVQELDYVDIIVDGVSGAKYKIDLSSPGTSTSTILKDSAAELANTQGVELPSTGGIGTTIFYVVGAILVVGAGVLLVTRRRMSED